MQSAAAAALAPLATSHFDLFMLNTQYMPANETSLLNQAFATSTGSLMETPRLAMPWQQTTWRASPTPHLSWAACGRWMQTA